LSWPNSIAEIAERSRGGTQLFDRSVREFLDNWGTLSANARVRAIAEEPKPVDRIQDAYLGALAEHLALSERQLAPRWTEKGERFLDEPYFAGGLESLKAILLAQSPLAFRRRLIFISADALSRPKRVPDSLDA
jgi:hypothetical protein